MWLNIILLAMMKSQRCWGCQHLLSKPTIRKKYAKCSGWSATMSALCVGPWWELPIQPLPMDLCRMALLYSHCTAQDTPSCHLDFKRMITQRVSWKICSEDISLRNTVGLYYDRCRCRILTADLSSTRSGHRPSITASAVC